MHFWQYSLSRNLLRLVLWPKTPSLRDSECLFLSPNLCSINSTGLKVPACLVSLITRHAQCSFLVSICWIFFHFVMFFEANAGLIDHPLKGQALRDPTLTFDFGDFVWLVSIWYQWMDMKMGAYGMIYGCLRMCHFNQVWRGAKHQLVRGGILVTVATSRVKTSLLFDTSPNF